MTLIIESGATKAEWALRDGSGVLRFRTPGINAAVMPVSAILEIVADAAEKIDLEYSAGKLCPGFSGNPGDAEDGTGIGPGGQKASSMVTDIRYYGAGLVGGESIIILDNIFKAVFPAAEIAYGSDLLAAAMAGLGTEPGIVAILGTGSNSAFYDGHQIVRNIRPGGFILGDEGGGVTLGKAFVADFIKGLLPEELADAFRERFGLTYETIVKNVYSGTNPSGYLASFVPFILENRSYGCVAGMVRDNFQSFISRCIMQYDYRKYPVAVVGSFGNACREELMQLGVENGVNFCKFAPSPIEALIYV